MEGTLVDLASKGTGWMVAVYMFYLLIKEKDKRVGDAQQNANAVTGPLKTIQETLDLIKERLERLKS